MNNYSQKKPWKEMLSEFLSEPTRPNLRRLLQSEPIEDNDIDFKEELISETKFEIKLAKHIIAMANKQGGVIIFGLKETDPNSFEPVGIQNKIDPTDLEKKLGQYLSYELIDLISIIPITYTESEYEKLKGKTFIIIIIDYDPKYIPFMPLKDGDGIKRNTIYIRKNRATEAADYDDIQNILNRRVETEYSSSSERKLREHLEELKELYTHISQTIGSSGYVPKLISLSRSFSRSILQESKKVFEEVTNHILNSEDDYVYVPPKPNPNYPEEDYEQFVARMIKLKKNIIEDVIKK